MADTPARNSRKTINGIVATRSGDKTVKVSYAYKIPHPIYGKEINRKTVVAAHDENNECGVGDRVIIMETRPVSKLKRFRIVQVVQKAPIIGV